MSREPLLPSDRYSLILGCLRITDMAIVGFSGWLAYVLRHDSFVMPFYYEAAIVLAAVLTVNLLHVAGVYRWPLIEQLPWQMLRAVVAWTLVLMLMLALAYFTRTSDWFSRTWVVLWLAMVVVGFALARFGVIVLLWRWRMRGMLGVNVAVVGARDLGRAVLRQLNRADRSDIRIVGLFDSPEHLPAGLVEGVPTRGSVDDLVALARHERIDEIVLAMVDRSEEEIDAVLAKLRQVPINVKLCAHVLRFNLPVRGFTNFAGLPLLNVLEKPLTGWSRVGKAIEDRLLGGLLLLLLLPAMAVVALAIKLDSPGPVLFRQRRYGFNNNEITVFKFRSMRHDPDPDPSVPQARRNDPRVTRIGAFLRRSSLDELPQLFNVLRGEMSLVGPRPHAIAHNEQYAKVIDGYLGRHRVKPGITGWAQVNGLRGETDTPEKMRMRVQYDLFYIDNWSLMFDLKILAMTGMVGFVNKNAY